MKVGLIDADLLDNGTTFPNLAIMKMSAFLKSKGIHTELLMDGNNIDSYDVITVSKVFTSTNEPSFIHGYKGSVMYGGTGWYMGNAHDNSFNGIRYKDLHDLPNTKLFNGLLWGTQMPDYHIYDSFIETIRGNGKLKAYHSSYTDFSIGFLTRGCFRKCPFCVNRNESKVFKYSELSNFLDSDRKVISLLDDNFLGYAGWEDDLTELQATGKQFQFKQGLDIRLLTPNRASMLSKSKYYGDFIFAFDNIKDKDVISRKLDLWRSITDKSTKLYLFCGFEIGTSRELLIKDILELFERIEILMRYKCLGYVMRYKDYALHPMSNIYVQIARWVNQPSFYKKMSFRQFCELNQKGVQKECMSMRTLKSMYEEFPEYKSKLDHYFNMEYEQF
jgi:hypothetical protein